ncbi:hypothetical protein G3N57_31430 [Paraburkholderia sp. Se-20369]|nr:hypothetical protein [Paraburkholderia sp. Se-20369]
MTTARDDRAAGQVDAAAADVDVDAMRAPAVGIDGDVVGADAAADLGVEALGEEAGGADLDVAQHDARAGAAGGGTGRTGAGREQAGLAGGGQHAAVDGGEHRPAEAGRRIFARCDVECDAVRALRTAFGDLGCRRPRDHRAGDQRDTCEPARARPAAGRMRLRGLAIHLFTSIYLEQVKIETE